MPRQARLLMLAVGLCTPCVCLGQSDTVTVTVRVVDTSDETALDSVVVLLPELNRRLVSDSSGQVLVEGIDAGTYDMIVTRAGYQELNGRFTIDRSGSFQIGLGLVADVRVMGTVHARESGDALSGAIVRIGGVAPVLTDDEGRFVAPAVPRGRRAIEVEYLGRAPSVDTLVLGDAELVSVSIRLEERPVELAGLDVVVEPRSLSLESAGLYERRDRWALHGTYVTRAEIDRGGVTRPTDLLRMVPGTHIEYRPDGMVMRIHRGGPGGCEPTVYVDGLVYHDPSEVTGLTVRTLDFLSTAIIEGIEVYVGLSTPARFYSDCGAIVIWTRGYR